jgi:hypothetical protein
MGSVNGACLGDSVDFRLQSFTKPLQCMRRRQELHEQYLKTARFGPGEPSQQPGARKATLEYCPNGVEVVIHRSLIGQAVPES